MVVWGTSGLVVWGEGVFGSGAVVLKGGLVLRGCGLAVVITIGAVAVVWTWGLAVVLGRRRGGSTGGVGVAGVGTAGGTVRVRKWTI